MSISYGNTKYIRHKKHFGGGLLLLCWKKKNTAQTEGIIKSTGFVVTLHAMIFLHHRHFRQTYLSSCQNEFVSNSGSTSVAFMIRATTTALHIYKIKAEVILNLSAMLPWIHKTCMVNYATLERESFILVIQHWFVRSSRRCTGHTSTHCSQIQLVCLQVERLHFRNLFCHHSEWHRTGETYEANRCVVQKMLSNHLNLRFSTTHLQQHPWVVALISVQDIVW